MAEILFARIDDVDAVTAVASAAAAAASADAATTQATTATTQATNAASSAATASTQASNAAASAVAAAASADAFDDVYLGSKAADPTLDNDGNALVEGQLYWNNVANNLRIYDGAAWNAYSATAGIMSLVEDTSPQLGGDLDLNGHVITGMVIGTNVQAYDAELAAIAGLTSAADKGIQFTGSGTAGTYDLTTAAKTVLDDTTVAAMRTTLITETLGQTAASNVQTGSYQLVLADGLGVPVRMNVGSANNLTVPTNATVAFPTETYINIEQYGAGQTTVVAAGGVTIRTPSDLGLKMRKQYSMATLHKINTDEWILGGDISA